MSKRVVIQAAPFQLGESGVEVEVTEPGTLRYAVVALVESQIAVPGEAPVREVPVLYLETHEGMPTTRKTFVAVPQGGGLSGKPGNDVEYRTSCIAPATGGVIHIFEVVAKKMISV